MKKRFSFLARALLLLLVIPIISGCAAIPVSDQELSHIGGEVTASMIAEYGVYRDEKVDSYVNSVGKRVEAGSGYQGEPIEFVVLDTPIINAFSVPGGHIFVTRGLLARVNSESELAFVLGHEIGHLTAKHVASRISQLETSNIFSSLLGTFIGMYSKDQQLGNLVANIVDFSSILVILNYGRDAEFQADSLGLKYAYDSNYNPLTADKFLATLKLMEESKGERSSLTDLLATHPPTDERVKRSEEEAQELAAVSPGKVRTLDIRRDNYLGRINGLVLGDSLDSGFEKDGTYYNKKYLFVYKQPDGWKMQNARSYLAAVYQDQNNVFFVYASIESSARPIDAYAAAFLRQAYDDQKLEPEFKATSFLDLPAFEYYRSKTKNVHALFFKRAQTDYALVYSYVPAGFADHDSLFNQLTKNFSFMADDAAKGISEDSIKIYKAAPKDTWANISVKFYGDPQYKTKLMKYNGIDIEVRSQDVLKVPPIKYFD